MHSRCSAFAFVFFDFARSPTDAKPPDACLRALVCVGATRSGLQLQLRAILRVGLACLARASARLLTAQLAFSPCGSWLRPSRPLATWPALPLAITGRVVLWCCSCSSSDSTKLLGLLNPLFLGAWLASNTSFQLLDGLQALAFLPN